MPGRLKNPMKDTANRNKSLAKEFVRKQIDRKFFVMVLKYSLVLQ